MLKRLVCAATLMATAPILANDAMVPQTAGERPVEPAAPTAETALSPEMIQARKDRYERLTVPVTIEGEGPYRFMIDTGAQATVVTHGLSKELALPALGKATLVAMGSQRVVDMVKLDGLEFAGRLFDNLEAPLLERQNVGADGILGLNSLQDMRVMIDFKDDRMWVSDAADNSGSRGFEIVVRARRKLGQMIITNARIDGIRAAVVIDTGAQNSVGNIALRNKMRARGDTVVTSTDVNGVQVTGNLGYARKMQIGGVELAGVPMSFTQSPAFAALDLEKRPAIILGMQNLKNFDRIAIDFATRRILFDLPSGAYNVNPYNRTFFPTRIPAS